MLFLQLLLLYDVVLIVSLGFLLLNTFAARLHLNSCSTTGGEQSTSFSCFYSCVTQERVRSKSEVAHVHVPVECVFLPHLWDQCVFLWCKWSHVVCLSWWGEVSDLPGGQPDKMLINFFDTLGSLVLLQLLQYFLLLLQSIKNIMCEKVL